MTAAIRPTQFSALNPLDPLDEKEEHGEDNDRHGHVEKVIHGHSWGGNHWTRASTLDCGEHAGLRAITLDCGPGGVDWACARSAASDGYQSPLCAWPKQ